MDDHGGAVAACATRLVLAGSMYGPGAPFHGIALADGDQGVSHALVEGRSITPLTTGACNERALDHGVVVLGERPRQSPAPVVEAEEAPGVEPGRALVGLVPCGQCQLADLLGRPVRRLFSELCIGIWLGDLDERLDLVEGELPVRQRIGDLGQ